jgi:AraC family transcriptional activator of pobA
MPAVLKEKIIPTYSLQESSSLGSTMFEIVEAKGEPRRRKADFLIPHRKDYYMLVFVKKGNSRHWVDGIPYVIKPDTLYFATPQQIHVKEKSEPLQGTLIFFTEEFLQLEENHLLLQLPVILNPDNQHELALTPDHLAYINDILKKMQLEFNTGRDWRNSMLLSYLRVLLIYISRLYIEQYENTLSSDNMLLKKFRAHIDRQFTTHHLVADYAQLLSISPGHLNDLVKEQSGKTAIEHIHERIVLEAKRHLLHTEWSMKEIAHHLGFEDAAYFSRFFKRLTGGTPAAYRTSIREMYQ